jgi:flagellar hook protein FlgE
MAFDTSVSGILSASADLGIIGNNVANASTTGFKQSRGEFTDIYATSLLGTAGTAIGQGVKLNSVTQDFSQGNIEFTNNSLDLAINGNGFFRMSNDGVATYTRAGSFQLDREGYLVNASNMKLQGFPIDEAGNITGELGDIQLSTALIDPKPTSLINLTANVDSRDSVPATPWAAATLTPEMFNSSTSMTIYDSLGNPHVLSLYFQKLGEAGPDGLTGFGADGAAGGGDDIAGEIADNIANPQNQWLVRVLIDGEEMAETEEVAFLNSGKLDNSGGLETLTIAGWTPKDADGNANGAQTGAEGYSFTLDLNSLTQFGAEFAVGSISQDGYATGQLRGVEIDATGILYTRYTNGQSRQQSQIALASFTNPNGLQPVGDTSFVETFSAGAPTITTPGLSGTGALQSGALEGSNVEITSQLVRMIVAQRNFQANAQMIQTEDAVTQTVINLR